MRQAFSPWTSFFIGGQGAGSAVRCSERRMNGDAASRGGARG